jgi:hypothetical protein
MVNSPWFTVQACKAAELAGLQVREAQEAKRLHPSYLNGSRVNPLKRLGL